MIPFLHAQLYTTHPAHHHILLFVPVLGVISFENLWFQFLLNLEVKVPQVLVFW